MGPDTSTLPSCDKITPSMLRASQKTHGLNSHFDETVLGPTSKLDSTSYKQKLGQRQVDITKAYKAPDKRIRPLLVSQHRNTASKQIEPIDATTQSSNDYR